MHWKYFILFYTFIIIVYTQEYPGTSETQITSSDTLITSSTSESYTSSSVPSTTSGETSTSVPVTSSETSSSVPDTTSETSSSVPVTSSSESSSSVPDTTSESSSASSEPSTTSVSSSESTLSSSSEETTSSESVTSTSETSSVPVTTSSTESSTSAPDTTSEISSSYSTSETSGSTEGLACAEDMKQCPDGSFVRRNPDNYCQYFACPIITTVICSKDGKLCPGGRTVGRDPNNNCTFYPCPNNSYTDCEWCQPETGPTTRTTYTSTPSTTSSSTSSTTSSTISSTTSSSTSSTTSETTSSTTSETTSSTTSETTSSSTSSTTSDTTDQTESTENETEVVTVTTPEQCPKSLLVCGICYNTGLPLGNSKNSTCGRGTSRFGGHCACWSGAYGKNCSMDNAIPRTLAPFPWKFVSNENYLNLDSSQQNIHFEYNFTGHSTCAKFIRLEDLETIAPPVIESTTFTNSNLDILISQPMVSGRAETIAYLNAGHDNLQCIYPTSDYITKEIDGCKDIFHFSIPWNISSTCSWRILEEETHTSYCGQVVLQHSEWMSDVCEWRFVQSVLNVKLRIQKFARVTIKTVVVNRPDIASAITNQIVLVNSPEPVLIEITTYINWPYTLDTNFNLTKTPPGKIQSYTLNFEDCVAEDEKRCKQKWRTNMDLTRNTCTIDGSYQLTYPQVRCVTSNSTCPLTARDAMPVKIDYTLTSENFCAVFKVDISLSATINVFEDSTFRNSRYLFAVGQKAYFLVKAQSTSDNEENPIELTSIKIKSVTLRGEISSIPVYVCENGEPRTISGVSGEETVNYITISRQRTNEIAFSFDMTSTLVSKLIRKNSKSTFIVGAEIEVSYTEGVKKRGVLEILSTGNDESTFSVETGIADFNTEESYSVVLVVCYLWLVVVVLVL